MPTRGVVFTHDTARRVVDQVRHAENNPTNLTGRKVGRYFLNIKHAGTRFSFCNGPHGPVRSSEPGNTGASQDCHRLGIGRNSARFGSSAGT